MATKDSIEKVREQLRIKNTTLKKLDAERARDEVKLKHLMAVTSKKISDLEQQVQEKTEQIKYQRSISTSRVTDTTSSGKPPAKHLPIIHEPLMTSFPEMELANQITQMLKELREKNQSLTHRIVTEKKEKDRLGREKSLLAREIRRLRDEPAPKAMVKTKTTSIETLTQESDERYKKLLKEKDRLINTYEQLIVTTEGNSESIISDEVVIEITKELKSLREEKDETDKELQLQRKKFKVHLDHEVKRIEGTIGKKLKRAQRNRKKNSQFSEELREDQGTPFWMVTYADMAILLLTFFILYYSLASVNMKKFKEAIIGNEQASIGLLELLDAVESKESIEILTGMRTDDILADIKKVADQETMSSVMEVSNDRSKIIVRVPGQTLFEPGKALLKLESSKAVLTEIIRIVAKYPRYKISIQGHTDDSPISTVQFPTNWELSSARATAVLRYFIDKNIDPKRLTATGYGEIFPIASNQTEMGKAANRRVEFVLEKEK